MKYTTSRGVEIEVWAIQTLWDKLQAAHVPPTPPTYALVIGGVSRQAELTQVIIDKGEASESERAAWVVYLQERDAYNAKMVELQKRLVYNRAIRFAYPADDAWVKAQEADGLPVPEDPEARRYHFIETEVFGGMTDYLEVIQLSMTLGLPEEARRQAAALFRREMERAATERLAPPQQGKWTVGWRFLMVRAALKSGLLPSAFETLPGEDQAELIEYWDEVDRMDSWDDQLRAEELERQAKRGR